MRPDTGAGIIISDADYSDVISSIRRQFLCIVLVAGLGTGYVGFANRQILLNNIVDLCLDLCDFVLRKFPIKVIVTF
jgi:hypothetical protein